MLDVKMNTPGKFHMQLKGPSYYYSKNPINMLVPELKDRKVFLKKCAIENIYKSCTRN